MAKSDSFFIRERVRTTADDAWATEEIALGAFVDALGKTVLRIKNIAVQFKDVGTNGPPIPSNVATGGTAYLRYVLTTQPLDSTTVIIDLAEKSLIASGTLQFVTGGGPPGAANNTAMSITQVSDVAPQHWSDGYLVGVETIYLSIFQNASMGADENSASIILECVSETMTSKSAMALALSQQ